MANKNKKEYSAMLDPEMVEAIDDQLDRGDSRSALFRRWLVEGAVRDGYLDEAWRERIDGDGDQEASGDE